MTGEKDYHVYKYEYIKGSIKLKKAMNKESKNINVDKLTYKEIILLVKKIKEKFIYKPEKGGFDDYFYDVPLWTEGYR